MQSGYAQYHDTIIKGTKAADLINKEEEEKMIVTFLGKAIAIFIAWHLAKYFQTVFMELFSADDVSSPLPCCRRRAPLSP